MKAVPATDTIAAIATASGRGGIGIVRLSGPASLTIARQLLDNSAADKAASIQARQAHFCRFFSRQFFSSQQQLIDEGLLIWFPAPHSFTGEEVVELQIHGGPVVLDMLLAQVLTLGARAARAGEFSERAFINDKLDLAQAEAIADLIEAGSAEAARAAMHSLQGQFSQHIHLLVESLVRLRIYVEAAMDFPEEEIDFLAEGNVADQIGNLLQQLDGIFSEARNGVVLRDGMHVVLAGKPNAGKSSLLNALAGDDVAIVTPVPGTTRDILRERLHIDGMPLHITDTAGLRETQDVVEQEGIRRALKAIASADRILFLVDASENTEVDLQSLWPSMAGPLPGDRLTLVCNKIDLVGRPMQLTQENGIPHIYLSARTGAGMALLQQHLKAVMGYQPHAGSFSARRRHLDALQRARDTLQQALENMAQHRAGELVAEDLKRAQEQLGEITGAVSSDELLGRIFSSFCIGK